MIKAVGLGLMTLVLGFASGSKTLWLTRAGDTSGARVLGRKSVDGRYFITCEELRVPLADYPDIVLTDARGQGCVSSAHADSAIDADNPGGGEDDPNLKKEKEILKRLKIKPATNDSR
jgi:hypothetical protein